MQHNQPKSSADKSSVATTTPPSPAALPKLNDLTRAVYDLLMQVQKKTIDLPTLKKQLAFLTKQSSEFKNNGFNQFAIDFHIGVENHSFILSNQTFDTLITLLEKAVMIHKNSTDPVATELIELLLPHTDHFSPNCLWFATSHPDMLETLLNFTNFDPNQSCSYNVSVESSYPLQLAFIRTVGETAYNSTFVLLLHNADPEKLLPLMAPSCKFPQPQKNKEILFPLANAALALKNAQSCYTKDKFLNILEINAEFTKALNLRPEFVISYLTKALEAIKAEANGLKVRPGYPDAALLKHFLKNVSSTLKVRPELIQEKDLKDQLKALATELLGVGTTEERDKMTISHGPYLFKTQKKKEKICQFWCRLRIYSGITKEQEIKQGSLDSLCPGSMRVETLLADTNSVSRLLWLPLYVLPEGTVGVEAK